MSSYATIAQLASVGINAVALGSVSTTDQQAALDDASTEIDGYLASQYALPLTAWGNDLIGHVCSIAVYRLMSRRGYRAGGVDAGFKTRYDDAIAWATKISEGTVSPPGIIDSSPGVKDGAPLLLSGVSGNTIAGNATPSITLAGAKPYPFTGTIPGKRGW